MSVCRLWLPNMEEFLPESDVEYFSQNQEFIQEAAAKLAEEGLL